MKKLVISLLAASMLFAGGGDILRAQFLADRFELAKGGDKIWDINAFVGYDLNKFYIYSEGENSESQNELVYSHAISPFWDVQIGVEWDRTEDDGYFALLALQGLAPYWIETKTKLLVGEGAVGIDFDFEYETLFTQRLILNSRLESRYFTSAAKGGNYQGLNDIEVGFRLRYEIKREFAPYVGIDFAKNFAKKADAEGGFDSRAVIGLRFWF